MQSKYHLRSVADPDPHSFWSAGSGSALGIRIRIQEGKMNHKIEENSSFEVLDVLF